MQPMQPGELRHRINIQAKSPAQDDHGEPSEAYTNVWVDVPARIRTLSGREYYAAQQVQADVSTEIGIRWRPSVTAMHRITHQTPEQAALSPPEFTIYDIAAVKPDDETGRTWLFMDCINRSNMGFRSGT